ncbi:hypothetical protein ACFQ0T_22715 [Kitasatospora gansuensis]
MLATLGRAQAALVQLPSPEEAENFADIRYRWACAVAELVEADAYLNDAELGARLAHWVGYLDAAGSHRPCLDLLLVAGLAVRRGAREVARTLAGTGERKLGLLRRTDGVADRVAALRSAADALPVAELPVPVEEFRDWLAGHSLAGEQAADLLAAAHTAAPATDLLIGLAGALGALGHARAAADLLWARLELDPANDQLARVLSAALIDAGDGDGIRRLADRLMADSPADAYWVRARWAAAEGRWAEVGEHCAAMIVEDPSRINPRRLGALAATRLGDHRTAQRLYQDLLAHALPAEGTPADLQHRAVQGTDLWHLVTVASANRDWAVVRSTGALLGLDFEQDSGPVDEEWQIVTVRARRSNGSPADLPAIRTGPTARIMPVLGDDLTLNHGDVVVFGPTLLNEAPEDQDRDWRPAFELLTLLDPAGFTTWWLDGVWPGTARWVAFREALTDAGFAVWAHSGDGYTLQDPGTGVALPGVYAALGVPPLASAAEADAILTTLTKGWDHPLSWPELAAAAGVDVAPHREIVERYGL